MRSLGKFFSTLLIFAIVLALSFYITLKLIVTEGDEVLVPDLVGKNTIDALKLLTEENLTIKVDRFDYSPAYPKDYITFQNPDPGIYLREGQEVRVVISLGSEEVVIPDLSGNSLRRASIILEQNGLKPGAIARVHSGEISVDHVIAQFPPPMSVSHRESRVQLLVSQGQKEPAYVMPDFIGSTAAVSIPLIEQLGLILGKVSSTQVPDRPKGVILDQYPLGGSRVTNGSPVTFVVNQEFTSQKRGKQLVLVRYRVPTGMAKRKVQVKLTDASGLWNLHEKMYPPGSLVSVLALLDDESSVVMLLDGSEVKRVILED